jgi:hypothetical protein
LTISKRKVKQDYKKYNALYNAKYFTDLPKGEVNSTEKLFNEPYFKYNERRQPFY